MKDGIFFILAIFAFTGQAAILLNELETAVIDPGDVSVSGVSSGGAMAMQMHVAYSGNISGAGIIAGIPYYCTKGSILRALGKCTKFPSKLNPNEMIREMRRFGEDGKIDDVSHLANSRTFILHGTNDKSVIPAVGRVTETIYKEFIAKEENLGTDFSVPFGHGVPTLNYGNECSKTESPYMCRCAYSAAFHILNHIYYNLTLPSAEIIPRRANFKEFSQKEIFDDLRPTKYGMDDVGFVYVPTNCQEKKNKCKLHIVFHGCLMSKQFLEDNFSWNLGYNEVAEANDIIVVYPQAALSLRNPMACWDFWGLNGPDFAFKTGKQLRAIRTLIDKLIKKN